MWLGIICVYGLLTCGLSYLVQFSPILFILWWWATGIPLNNDHGPPQSTAGSSYVNRRPAAVPAGSSASKSRWRHCAAWPSPWTTPDHIYIYTHTYVVGHFGEMWTMCVHRKGFSHYCCSYVAVLKCFSAISPPTPHFILNFIALHVWMGLVLN